jgi:hypothetical protein
MIKFPAGNLNKYILKTISPTINVTGYGEIVFYIWSRNRASSSYLSIADYSYSINCGGSEYYIPVYPGFNCVVIGSASVSVDKIRITALHNDEDYICISEMNAVKEDFPLDIYSGIKEAVEQELEVSYPYGRLIGTTSCLVSAKSIVVSSDEFLDRFAVIVIRDGVHSETHQIWEFEEGSMKFTSLYDGEGMLNAYAGANVYLQFPVEYMAIEKEMIIPSIVLYGLNAERLWRGSSLEDITDSMTSAGASIRREGALEQFTVNIHCYARHSEIMAFLTRAVRHIINKQALWINGFYYEMAYEGTVSDIDPNQVYDLVPQMIYQIGVEIREEMYSRVSAVKITDTNINVYPEGAGTI